MLSMCGKCCGRGPHGLGCAGMASCPRYAASMKPPPDNEPFRLFLECMEFDAPFLFLWICEQIKIHRTLLYFRPLVA